MRPKHLKPCPLLPNLRKKNNDVASDIDGKYNCISFAAGITNIKWWPTWTNDAYWPPSAPKVETVEAFVWAFSTLGYSVSENGDYVKGVEKVALYTKLGKPTHAAKQVGPGKWQSKLGNFYDIVHTARAVSGGSYGEIELFLERPKMDKNT